MPASSESSDSEVPPKKRGGRPPGTVPRAEQFRRASAARRAGFVNLPLLLPPDLNIALEAAARDHPSGKSGFALEELTKVLRRKGFYSPPEK